MFKKDSKKILLNNIVKENREELFLTLKYILVLEFNCRNNDKILPYIKIIKKEFMDILKKERKIINYLFQNYYQIDYDKLVEIIDLMDEINENNVMNIYKLIEYLEDVVENEKVINKNYFDSKINDFEGYYDVLLDTYFSTMSFDKLLIVSGFPIDFINFLKNDVEITWINLLDDLESADILYGLYYVNENNIKKYKIVLPTIVDIESFEVNLQILMYLQKVYENINNYNNEELLNYYENDVLEQKVLKKDFCIWKRINRL